MKTLLLICHSSSSTGGAEDDFEQLLKYLSFEQNRYVIDALFPHGPRSTVFSKYCRKFGYISWGHFPVIYNGIWRYFTYLLKFFVQFFEIFTFVRTKKYDLCIINVAVLMWPILILKLFGFRVMVMVKETVEPRFFRNQIYRFLVRFTDYVIPNSVIIEEEFRRLTNTSDVRTIYSCVPECEVANVSEKQFIDQIGSENYYHLTKKNSFKFLCVGNAKRIKNQELIVHALLLTKEHEVFNRMDIFFVGDTSEELGYYRKLMKFVDINELSMKVHWIESVNKESLIHIYSLVDSLIISSLSEGIPLVLVYALKLKKFVVSTSVGGIPEVIKNRTNGFLVESCIESMAESIVDLSMNSSKYTYILENGYDTFINKFNRENNFRNLERIIWDLSR